MMVPRPQCRKCGTGVDEYRVTRDPASGELWVDVRCHGVEDRVTLYPDELGLPIVVFDGADDAVPA